MSAFGESVALHRTTPGPVPQALQCLPNPGDAVNVRSNVGG